MQVKVLNNTITVDPGWNTGMAYWIGDYTPLVFVIKEPPKRKKIKLEPTRLAYMFTEFKSFLMSKKVKLCVIEGVELWAGNVRSMTSASRGDLFALAYIVGGYLSICQQLGIRTKLVYPRGNKAKEKIRWKGQLDNEALDERIMMINGVTYKEHVREAVGIGFSIMGIL